MNIRTLSACVLITLLSTPLFGQTLYGLKKTVNGSMTIPFDVVNIDPSTGNTTIEVSTNSLVAVAAGATALKELNQPLDNKIYFAGEIYDTHHQMGVPGAILSGYDAVDLMLNKTPH
ncbi:MAG: FAD-dependent oxidoreductase [Bacteroidota bacterium]|nr:FAD-dependent oxidoreductase [Bacteroidota bacterium]